MQVGKITLPALAPMWDLSDMSGSDPLRGKALYDALMRLKPADLPETDWAVKAQVNRGFFSNLKGSDISPRSDTLRKLLLVIGKAEADLYAKQAAIPAERTLEDVADEFGLALVEEIDLPLGMGATYIDPDRAPERKGLVPFRASWLRDMFRGPLSALKVVRGSGDSMKPTIEDGDFVLIDTSRRQLDEQDVIWAVSYGDLGMIRRLRQLPNGGVMLMPDNAVVRPSEAYDGEMHIMGRVIWIGRRM